MKKALFVVGLVATCMATGDVSIDNRDAIRKAMGVQDFKNIALDNVKVAVLDVGFAGIVRRDNSGQLNIVEGSLPPTTKIVDTYQDIFPEDEACRDEYTKRLADATNHGAAVAQTIWATTNNNPTGPQFYLLNANELFSFRCAVKYARQLDVDIVVYSHNFPYGGDFDGHGYINQWVNEATSQGILWFQAAGNYSGRVYNGPVQEKTFHIRSNVDENPVTITLSWDGAQNDMLRGTNLDLDIEIKDPEGNILTVDADGNEIVSTRQVVKFTPAQVRQLEEEREVAKAPPEPRPAPEKEDLPLVPPQNYQEEEEYQKLTDPRPLGDGETPADANRSEPQSSQAKDSDASSATGGMSEQSEGEKAVGQINNTEGLYPYERVSLKLNRTKLDDNENTYTVRVIKRGGEFNATDNMRLTVLSPASQKATQMNDGSFRQPVELVEATKSKEIMIPADNPNVITIGDLEEWSSQGPTMDGREKPERLVKNSSVQLSTGLEVAGTSFGNPMAAGAAALMVGYQKGLEVSRKLTRRDILRFSQSGEKPASYTRTSDSLPQDARPVNVSTYQNQPFGTQIMDTLAEKAPNLTVEAFQREDGTFILGVNEDPREMFKRPVYGTDYPGGNRTVKQWVYIGQPNQYDYYASVRVDDEGKNRMFAAFRVKEEFAPRGLRAPYPWEQDEWRRLGYTKDDFVLIRQVSYKDVRVPGSKVTNLWMTPTLAELKKVVAGE